MTVTVIAATEPAKASRNLAHIVILREAKRRRISVLPFPVIVVRFAVIAGYDPQSRIRGASDR
ncbi:hypothetical protein FACS189487_07650 [Campylobacterota bacterium]|nr:hypothetical protein FACS189487_07650 [Campylobacterota bacterium]